MKNRAFSCVLLIACILTPAYAADWQMDPASSTLKFVTMFEQSPVPGVFREFDVRMSFDPQTPAAGSIEVTVTVTSADMNIADVNQEIAGEDWFDFVKFPQAEFRSTKLRHEQGSRFVASGTLDMKGVKQSVDVPFTWTSTVSGATMEGGLTLKRGAFGVGAGVWAGSETIGSDVSVQFTINFRQAG